MVNEDDGDWESEDAFEEDEGLDDLSEKDLDYL